jgi:hypothetical protein
MKRIFAILAALGLIFFGARSQVLNTVEAPYIIADVAFQGPGSGITGFAPGLTTGDSTAIFAALASTAAGQGDALVVGQRSEVGAVAFTQHVENQNRVPNIKTDFGAKGNGVWTGIPGYAGATATGTNDTAAFVTAIASGATKIRIPAGTYIVNGGFLIPNFLELEGDGIDRTIIYMGNPGTNYQLFSNTLGATSGAVGVRISGMTLHGNAVPQNGVGNVNGNGTTLGTGDGNQALNFNLNAPTVGFDNIPALTLDHIKITAFYGQVNGSLYRSALYTYGAGGTGSTGRVEADNVVIVDNFYAVGHYIKSTDGVYKGVYSSSNGTWGGGYPDTLLQQASDNKFIRCYFGGGGCTDNVRLVGAIYNEFIACTNDNTYGCNYHFQDDTGSIACVANAVIGGSCTAASQVGSGTWPNVLLEGDSHNNMLDGVKIYNEDGSTGVHYASYGVKETANAYGNLIRSCDFDQPFAFTSGLQVLLNTQVPCYFTATAGSGNLVVSAIASGSLAYGMPVQTVGGGTALAAGAVLTNNPNGGSTGTYTISPTSTVGVATTMMGIFPTSKVLDAPGYRGTGFVGAAYTTNAAQALTQGAWTVINFATKEYDALGSVQTGAAWSYTAPVAGVYSVKGAASWSGGSSSVQQLSLYKNAALLRYLNSIQTTNGTAGVMPFSTEVMLAAGDQISVEIYVGNTGITLQTASGSNHIQISRLPNS